MPKISELPTETNPAPTDRVVIVQGGVTEGMARSDFLKEVDADATFTDITTNNANTTTHGLLIKATAPASGIRNVVAIDNAETVYKNTALVDSTAPAAIGTAGSGSQLVVARRDHVHNLAISAASKLVGRGDSGAGDYQEITLGTNLSMSGTTLNASGGGGAVDADDVTYTPTTLADWDGGADPGDVEQALDQLAERITDVEGGGAGGDASAITYTPASNADWDSGVDPGNVDDALDQLANRVDNLESATGLNTITTVFEYDDFDSFVGSTAADCGSKFRYNCGAAPSRIASEANHPGLVRLSSTAGNSINPESTLGNMLLPSMTFTGTFIVRPNGHANARYMVGFWANAVFPPTNDGIYVEALAADTNWFLVTRAAGTQTRVDTGVAISNGTWYKISVYRKDASTIGAIVSAGGSEVTSTTNIPTNPLTLMMGLSVSSGTQTIDLDYWSYNITGITR